LRASDGILDNSSGYPGYCDDVTISAASRKREALLTIDQEMEATYGPAAKHSEHRRGDVIISTNEGIVTQGTILWVAAPGEIAGKQHPMRYIVEPDGETDTFPHIVYPGEVIRLAAGQEPVLVKCPYCTGRHLESQIEYCLFNPNRPK
jgi:hypothetical protein